MRHLCLLPIPIAFLLAVATRDEVDRRYCTNCGLLRLTTFRTCFGLAGPRSTREHETSFRRLLLSTGRIECTHRWQGFYYNHHHVQPGENRRPYILADHVFDADLKPLLDRLEDPDKIAAILTSFDLTQEFDALEHLTDVQRAFEKLEAAPDATGEEAWWQAHRHLFVGRLPPNPALQRTPHRREVQPGLMPSQEARVR